MKTRLAFLFLAVVVALPMCFFALVSTVASFEKTPILHIVWRGQGGDSAFGRVQNLTDKTLHRVRLYVLRPRTITNGGFPVDQDMARVYVIFPSYAVDFPPGANEGFWLFGTTVSYPADIHAEVDGREVAFSQELKPL